MSSGDGSIVWSINDGAGTPLGTIALVPDKYAAGVPVSYRVASMAVPDGQDRCSLYCQLLAQAAVRAKEAGGRRVHVPVRPGDDVVITACGRACKLTDGVLIIPSLERGGL